ncbi:cdc42 effector protein 3 [Amia ocellicauda]|uniref:cdc42 effector protein 3 n=1 Tax=Amia ocellicauda TaxID=2972642 RepID=UPI00346491C7|nr:BORG1 protein [Amia calva]
MPLKTSLYLKSASARWPKKHKRKEVLSVNMISLPLGDFRHLSHIGSGDSGETFGDLTFLKRGHSLLLKSSQSEQNLILACAPPPKPPRLNPEEMQPQESKNWEPTSHRRKISSSMPMLDSLESDDLQQEDQGDTMDKLSFSSGRDSQATVSYKEESLSLEDDYAFSLDLDLGPSILDDVLNVMNKKQQ